MPRNLHKRILVIRTDRIGDVVLATPLIRALRETFPSSYIAAMVRPYTRDILSGNPHLNEILVDDPDSLHAGRSGFWNQVAVLRRHRFDTALLLLPTERLTWMLFAAGIRTRVTVGLKLNQVLTFMKTVSRQKYIPLRHEADYCLDLGRRIGVCSSNLDTEVFLSPDERREGAELLIANGVPSGSDMFLVGIHPGSGNSAPNWTAARYQELAQLLLKDPRCRIILTGSEGERPYSEAFHSLGENRIIDFVGTLPLRGLMAVIAQCHVLISASTGPMHIAAALRVPTVSLFCPLTACSPLLWGPRGNASRVILPVDGFCQGRCPGDPHVCRFDGGIEVEKIAATTAHFRPLPSNP